MVKWIDFLRVDGLMDDLLGVMDEDMYEGTGDDWIELNVGWKDD